MAAPGESKPAVALNPAPDTGHRRGFFAKAAAVVVGGIVAMFPFTAGLAVFFDPLRRTSQRGKLILVTSLDAVPEDGMPRKFPVIADRQDAWNYFPKAPIGAVFLRRESGSREVEALNVICPHAGCFVGFSAGPKEYLCPCHTSAFAIDGELISGPSPRGLDTLACEVREIDGRQEVWVAFENFYTGTADKKAKA
jgi:quinol---cytochrome c reductase iron-sulfur subunit, bacillus type